MNHRTTSIISRKKVAREVDKKLTDHWEKPISEFEAMLEV
jgi:hypothetical protein